VGYDLHITRRKEWFDEDGPELTRAEFERVVLADPEFRVDKGLGPNYAVWTLDPESPWVELDRGELLSKNPTKPFIQKMVRIAQALGNGARVVGDEDEEYGPEPTPPPGPAPGLRIAAMGLPLAVAAGLILLRLRRRNIGGTGSGSTPSV
jgi:hypothetical protein